jgi:hypothetical protein
VLPSFNIPASAPVGYPMKISMSLLLRTLVVLLLCSTSSQAEQSSSKRIEISGNQYELYQSQDKFLVLQSPQLPKLKYQSSLVRRAPPECSHLKGNLQTLEPWVQQFQSGELTGRSMKWLKTTLNEFRTMSLDAWSLNQYWEIVQNIPAIDETTLRAISTKMEVPVDRLLPVSRVSLIGAPSAIVASPLPGGTGLVNRYSGIVDLNDIPVTFQVENGVSTFVTHDHLIACGLMERDVIIETTQPARLEFVQEKQDVPSEQGLWTLYETLRTEQSKATRSPGPFNENLWNAVQVGARLSMALEDMHTPEVASESVLRYIIHKLYDADLKLLPNLERASLADQAISVTATINLRSQVEERQ